MCYNNAMRNRYRKKRNPYKRRRSSYDRRNRSPFIGGLFTAIGILLAAAILTFGVMFTLEAVFKIDTPLKPDGFVGKTLEKFGLNQPFIVPTTPYISPEPSATPHPMDAFNGEVEEKEIVLPTDISYPWLGSPFCYNGKIVCSAGKIVDGRSLMCALIEYDIESGSARELPISSKNGQLINAVFNDDWFVYLDANIENGGGDLCVIDLKNSSTEPIIIKEIHVDQPEFKLEGDYITWIERTGSSRDKVFVCHLPTQETTAIHAFDRSGYGTSMPYIHGKKIIWAAEDNAAHQDGVITSAIKYISLNEQTIGDYLPNTYVHDPECNDEFYAWLDAPHDESTILYTSNGVDAPIAVDTGVVEFGIGDNFIAYGKDEAIFVYLFDLNKTYRITPEREMAQFLGVSDGYIMWMDVTSRERDIIRYTSLPEF